MDGVAPVRCAMRGCSAGAVVPCTPARPHLRRAIPALVESPASGHRSSASAAGSPEQSAGSGWRTRGCPLRLPVRASCGCRQRSGRRLSSQIENGLVVVVGLRRSMAGSTARSCIPGPPSTTTQCHRADSRGDRRARAPNGVARGPARDRGRSGQGTVSARVLSSRRKPPASCRNPPFGGPEQARPGLFEDMQGAPLFAADFDPSRALLRHRLSVKPSPGCRLGACSACSASRPMRPD